MAISEALTLGIVLKLTDEASEKLKSAAEGVSGFGKAAIALGAGAAAGVAVLAKGLWDAAQAAGEEEKGIAKLGAAVRATGADWDTASAAIEAYLAKELQRTALDDGAGREAITRLTIATGDYRRALELMPLVQDLARAKGMDLAAAAEIVGKVHEGNTGILKRYGIELDKDASAQEALAAMQERFAGQAEAYGATFAGAQEKMDIALGNLKETVGAAVLPVLTNLINVLANLAINALPYVETALQNLEPVAAAVFAAVQTIVETVFPAIQAVVETTLTALQAFWQAHGDTIIAIVSTTFNAIYITVETILTMVQAVVETILHALQAFWQAHGDEIQTVVATTFNTVRTIVEITMPIVQGVIQTALALIHGDWKGAWEGVKNVFISIWDAIKTVAALGTEALRNAMAACWKAIKDAIPGAWEGIKEQVWLGLTGVFRYLESEVGTWTAFGRRFIENLAAGIRSIHIPLPHFSLNWGEVLGIRYPTGVSVSWYGAGANFIAAYPMLIGVGERGPERVIIQPLGGNTTTNATTQYILNYTAVRPAAGYRDAVAAMRELELLTRLRAKT